MLREVLQFLDLKPGLSVLDGTVGAAGHSRAIAERLGPEGRLVGCDRDPMMLDFARERLRGVPPTCHLIHTTYAHILDHLAPLGVRTVERALFDLGYSSDQLADDSRGFSFQSLGEFDLRFDRGSGLPAWQLLQEAPAEILRQILHDFGEEPLAEAIVDHFVSLRKQPLPRAARDIADQVARVYEARRVPTDKNPATRFFQAFRIAVNAELEQLRQLLDHTLPQLIAPGGRVLIITFHSLEDRMVKTAFRQKETWHALTPKPIEPTPAEVRLNPRSRSAKLRVAERV